MDTSNSIFTIANAAPSIDVVEKVCGIKTKGGWFSSPFREDKNPSCKCSDDTRFKARITDFGAIGKDKHFTNINFVCKKSGIDAKKDAAKAAKIIIDTLNLHVPASAPTSAPTASTVSAASIVPVANSELREAAKKSYINRGDYGPILARGISEDVIKDMKLWYDKKANAIVIPTYNGSGLSGLIYRNLDLAKPKYQNSKGFDAAGYIYGLDHLSQTTSYVYVVEGWFDYLACRTAGIQNVIALHTCTMTNKQAELLSPYRLILALDADKSGQENLHSIMAVRSNVIGYIKYPKGCKDANDVLLKNGSKGLLKCFKKVKKVKLPKYFINK